MKSILSILQVLKEGGNAISVASRINQENVATTLKKLNKDLSSALKIKEKDFIPVGSTGKKAPGDSSGDIDMAISIKALQKSHGPKTEIELIKILKAGSSRISKEVVQAGQLVTFAYPIDNKDGKQENEFVQVDLFLTDSLEYSSWAYFSPSYKESDLKGVYRNVLIGQILKVITSEIISDTEQTKMVIDFKVGLIKNYQTIMGKTGRLKGWKTINKDFISNKPDEIAKIIFGDEKATARDTYTVESVLNYFKKSRYKNKLSEVLKETIQAYVNMGLPVPAIIKSA